MCYGVTNCPLYEVLEGIPKDATFVLHFSSLHFSREEEYTNNSDAEVESDIAHGEQVSLKITKNNVKKKGKHSLLKETFRI